MERIKLTPNSITYLLKIEQFDGNVGIIYATTPCMNDATAAKSRIMINLSLVISHESNCPQKLCHLGTS
jgi:hypothetical protein